MPKRIYWDRSLYKDVREVYRKKKKPRKARYTSKAYRAALAYHLWRFSGDTPMGTLGALVTAALYEKANRPGFMRRVLGGVKAESPPVNPWYAMYKAENVGDYNPKKAYAIPPRDQWVRWTNPEVQTQNEEAVYIIPPITSKQIQDYAASVGNLTPTELAHTYNENWASVGVTQENGQNVFHPKKDKDDA